MIVLFAFSISPVELQNDTFYTIKIGEHILENGIDMRDPFSYHDLEYIDDDGLHYYDFSNTRNDKSFHSGSKYISNVEEWKYRYSEKQKSEIVVKASETEDKKEE